MRPNIHPVSKTITVLCTCGSEHTVSGSTYPGEVLRVEVCKECHPFYTGKHRTVSKAGRVEEFNRRWGRKTQPQQEQADQS